ncbi:baseplate J/gp47 family protein [Celerinatantimonas sp. YJH-8]|uniref:baseplate assembly protein n=1 Tax=Celerinatantimonas sp. YJH-8 TaxID=3228714 RepID=UPI0038BEC3CB
MSISDLSALPAPSLLEELDYETILSEMIERYQLANPDFDALLESDPIYKTLEVAAYYRVKDRQRVNEAAKAVMLALASDADLDQIGARYAVERQLITPADETTIPPTDAVYESDDDFRRRILLAFDGLSVAGPEQSYISHALSADPSIADVSAMMTAPGQVQVTLLSRNGNGQANASQIAHVAAALNAEEVRPLTDQVRVQSAEIINYSVSATLYMQDGPEQEPILTAANAALDTYVANQQRLGRNIRRSAIMAALSVSGVQYVDLTQPAEDLVLSRAQASYCTETSIRNGGNDDG